LRINLNGGDKLMWSGEAADYTGDLGIWPEFLESFLDLRPVTDIILFGDCRPHHVAAVSIARQRGIMVHVFEEGYLRPDWVTLEVGGVNGHSRLPRDPAWYLAEAAALPDEPPGVFFNPPTFGRRALDAVYYNAAEILMRWRFRHFRTHRVCGPFREGVSWLFRLAARGAEKRRSENDLLRMGNPSRLYLMPLQLDTDSQIRLHSPFTGVQEAIEQVITSFAANAPDGTVLLLKAHPLDNGINDWRRISSALAQSAGVQDRVFYIETGNLEMLLSASSGVVTVNSTSGTFALAMGIPVLTLGHAVYDIAGITDQGDLGSFWITPQPPDQAVFSAFRKVLASRCLIRGGFYGDDAIAVCVKGSVPRIEYPVQSFSSVRREALAA
jgi:capsular polysaccharide export protein